MYNVTEVAEKLDISRNKLLKYIREEKIEPTVFSLTGRHLFDDKGIENIKKFLEKERNIIRSKEVAYILGISISTVNNYIKRGLIKPIKVVNGINYFDRKEIEVLSLSCGNVDFDNLIMTSEVAEILGITKMRVIMFISEKRLIPDRILPCGRQFFLRDKIERIADLARELEEKEV